MAILHHFKPEVLFSKMSNLNIITFYDRQNMFKLILKTSRASKEKNYHSILFSGIPNLILKIHNLHHKYA